jgi:hypothetical protein
MHDCYRTDGRRLTSSITLVLSKGCDHLSDQLNTEIRCDYGCHQCYIHTWTSQEVPIQSLHETFLILVGGDDCDVFARVQTLFRFVLKCFGKRVATCHERKVIPNKIRTCLQECTREHYAPIVSTRPHAICFWASSIPSRSL